MVKALHLVAANLRQVVGEIDAARWQHTIFGAKRLHVCLQAPAVDKGLGALEELGLMRLQLATKINVCCSLHCL